MIEVACTRRDKDIAEGKDYTYNHGYESGYGDGYAAGYESRQLEVDELKLQICEMQWKASMLGVLDDISDNADDDEDEEV